MSKLNEVNFTYEIVENGFYILNHGRRMMKQLEPNIPRPDLSYEENAQLMIEDMLASREAEAQRLSDVEELNTVVEEQNAVIEEQQATIDLCVACIDELVCLVCGEEEV